MAAILKMACKPIFALDILAETMLNLQKYHKTF